MLRKLISLIPGTALNIAQKKRAFEKKLRAEGYTRTQAATIVANSFNKSPLHSK